MLQKSQFLVLTKYIFRIKILVSVVLNSEVKQSFDSFPSSLSNGLHSLFWSTSENYVNQMRVLKKIFSKICKCNKFFIHFNNALHGSKVLQEMTDYRKRIHHQVNIWKLILDEHASKNNWSKGIMFLYITLRTCIDRRAIFYAKNIAKCLYMTYQWWNIVT